MKSKLAVLCCAHTYPEVAELSIGSFLREHSNYEIDLHVGCHSNYADYCKDLRLFSDLKGIGSVHLVDEIDWLGVYNACWYRYSVMHAKNLENLFRQVRYSDFDHLVLLDHDLFVKGDFVTPLLEAAPDGDLIGDLFEDEADLRPYETAHDEKIYRAPKISVWHALLSRRLYEKILKNPSLIYPKMITGDDLESWRKLYGQKEDRPIFADTFAQVYHAVVTGPEDMSVCVPGSDLFRDRVTHFYNSSFNYGYWTRRESYPAHIQSIIDVWKKEFPDGLPKGIPQNI